AHDMLAGLRSTDDPFLANARGQRDIDGIDIFRHEQFFVTAQRAWRSFKRTFALAVGDEFPAALHIAARHGHDDAIAAIADAFPVLAPNLRRAEKSPAKFVSGH